MIRLRPAPGQRGRPRVVGTRQPSLQAVLRGRRDSQALLCTDPDGSPNAILTTYLQHWQVEVTFQEVCTHLDIETQRP